MHANDRSPDPVETFLTDLARAPVPPDLAPAVAARVREERPQQATPRSSPLPALVAALSLAVVIVAVALVLRVSRFAGPTPAASAAPPGASLGATTQPPTPAASSSAGLGGLRLTCADVTFPATALAGPAGAEDGTGGAATALHAFLADPQRDYSWPRDGWRELVANSRLVVFAASDPRADHRGQLLFVKAETKGSGWSVVNSGACSPLVHVGRGFRPASWELAQRVSPTTTQFTVLVKEEACASGRSPAGRIMPPHTVVDARSVTITFSVRALPGGQDCQGAPPAPYRVRLPEPLGNRELRDGIVFPPRLVAP